MKEKTKRVAVCLIRNWSDDILMGKRNDNGKYTNPGGHLDRNEDPHEGVIRELKEETGLDALDVKLVSVTKGGKNKDMIIYVFEVKVDESQQVDVSGDPDKECKSWEYIDPNDVVDELHVPLEYNSLLKYWANN